MRKVRVGAAADTDFTHVKNQSQRERITMRNSL